MVLGDFYVDESRSDNDNTQSFVPLIKGTEIGHYKIIEKIGAGGMGEVYLAEDTELKREVALKFLPPHLCADEDCRARFKREAQAAAALKHPNIITIYEVSDHNGRPFFAMELVEGESLREIIKGKALTINSIIDLVIQICEGLGKAHDADIIHRDIKPTNIIIDDDGRPKILDFGLAAVQGEDKLTKTGSTLGTVGYMSPEQVKGEEVDHRSDLFSVGVLLYEMITGKRPFEGEGEAAILNSILNTNPEPLARYKKDIPDDLQRIVFKLLEKDVELRYQTSAGIISDLKTLRRESELSAISSPVTITKKRYSKIIIPVAVIIIALAVLIFKPWKFEFSPRQEAIAQENKLAVMYFDNLADPSDSLKLGEITTNLLITNLSESEYVQVVSSQRLYDILKQLGHEGEKIIDRNIATKVAEKAKARWMLLGSILKTKPNIVLTAQLVEVESGNAIASQRIEGKQGEDIFPLVDNLTIEIKNDLSLPTGSIEQERIRIADATTHSIEAYRYYLEGKDLFEKHYWTDAQLSFKKALEDDSTIAMAYYYLATIDSWRNKKSDARDWINKAIQHSDRINKKQRYWINSLDSRINGDFNRAIEELEKIIIKNPDEKDVYITIGVIKYHNMEKPVDAIPYFNKAIELDPYSREAHNQLAYIYNDLGQFEKAIGAINKYIEVAPDEANPYDSKGEIYALNGKLDEAIASYEKANELKSGFSTSNLGDLYLFKRNYAQAEDLYRTLVSDPNKSTRANGRLKLANIPTHQGKFKDALRLLEIGIETDIMEKLESATINKIVRRYFIFHALNDWESAILELHRGLELIKKYDLAFLQIAALGSMAQLYAKTGNQNEADSIMKGLFNIVDTTNPEHLDYYWFVLGDYNFSLHNFDSAVFYFEKTNQIIPAFNDQIMIARSYFEIGRLGDAVAMFEKTINRYEFNRILHLILSVKAHYWLGLAYEQSGWNDKAIEQYEIFLDIWKNADEGLKSVEDAKERLAKLKSNI
jgi:serine/threonine protein kinase